MIHLLQGLPACYGVMVGQRKLLDLPTFRPFDELSCTESAVGCQGMCVEVNDQGLYTLHWIYCSNRPKQACSSIATKETTGSRSLL